jgi:putative membrane protein
MATDTLAGEVHPIHIMKIWVYPAAGLLIALLGAGCQRGGVQAANEDGVIPGSPLTLWDGDFVSNAAKAEARMATLSGIAVKKGQSVTVKEYAQALMDDYDGASRQLADLMRKKGIAPPVYLPEVKLEAANRLESVSDGAFDHEYISLMTGEQQQLASSFRQAGETASDPDVRAYAKGVTPVIERNLEKALRIEKSLSGKPQE